LVIFKGRIVFLALVFLGFKVVMHDLCGIFGIWKSLSRRDGGSWVVKIFKNGNK
jgi:hypothetical protein